MKSCIFLVALALGCSSNTTVIHEGDAAGGSAGETGGDAGASGGSGAGSGTGGSAGVSTDGTAGSAGSGGTGDAGAGTGGTGGSCMPKTCLTYAVEHNGTDACGVVSNGCGNFIDCGGCDDPAQKCGGSQPPNPDRSVVASDENTCGGGCTTMDLDKFSAFEKTNICFTTNIVVLFYCTVGQTAPSMAGTTCTAHQAGTIYCCQ